MCACLSCAPKWGPGLQPRHVPWLRIELVTLWFTGWHSIHWATPARAKKGLLKDWKTVFCFLFSEKLTIPKLNAKNLIENRSGNKPMFSDTVQGSFHYTYTIKARSRTKDCYYPMCTGLGTADLSNNSK